MVTPNYLSGATHTQSVKSNLAWQRKELDRLERELKKVNSKG